MDRRLIAITLLFWLGQAAAQSVLTPLSAFEAQTLDGRLHIVSTAAPPCAFLLATVDARLIVRLDATASTAAPSHWVSGPLTTAPSGAVRVFAVARDAVARLAPHWPADAELVATVETVGPAASSAWLSLGQEAGVTAGATFWRRANGQPIARFDVVFADRTLSYARVTPLVAPLAMAAGDEVTRWPRPSAERAGQAISAVSQLDTAGGRQLAWIAAPRQPRCAEDARVDFFRHGAHVGSGALEWLGVRFWHVRLGLHGERVDVQIGDDAHIRTDQDIQRRSFSARVFEQSMEGFLIDAGEADGIRVGEIAAVFRRGERLGQARIRKVQTAYAAIDPVGPGGAALEIGDEVRFSPIGPARVTIGSIEEIFGEGLFRARLSQPDWSGAAVAVQSVDRSGGEGEGGGVLGVAVLAHREGEAALGFVVPASRTGAIEVGSTLTHSE